MKSADKACTFGTVKLRWPGTSNATWKAARGELGAPLIRKVQVYMSKVLKEFEGVN